MSKGGFFSALGILLSVVAIAVLNEWDGRLPGESEEAKKTPLIIAEGVYAQIFDETGALEYVINTKELVENDYDFTTTLTQPTLDLYDGEMTWHIESENALLNNQKKELQLSGKVLAQQQQAQRMRLETEHLTYFSKTEKMHSDTPVRIQQGTSTTTAGGMSADAKTGILDLHKPVESRYVSE
ncbi:MAG TPA: LPS export ABC transporter periplasmic protein LptC [Alcanivoracaceae bacterium]|nr:LPS export ABC transporter periplasmic protein LptC [Alcanivoracaceae bacterium]